jgi:hypothetical protein
MDIWLGAFLLLIIAFCLFVIGALLASENTPACRVRTLPSLSVIIVTGCFLMMQNRLVLAQLLPFSGVVVFGDTLLPLTALLCGVLWGYQTRQRRPILLITVLMTLATVHTLEPFCGNPPRTGAPLIESGVVMQTTDSSCSAASAATLLRYYGIPATEEEIARLAFTREDGTLMLGVYRALCLKTVGTPYRVTALSGADISELRRAAQDGPVLLSVGLDRFHAHQIDPRYQTQWGWRPGKFHGVVLFGLLPGGNFDIGDPARGREEWGVRSLNTLWHGEALRLVRREGSEKVKRNIVRRRYRSNTHLTLIDVKRAP